MALQTLQPGQSVSFSFNGLTGWVENAGTRGYRTGPDPTGAFQVTFQYRYWGKDFAFANVFHGLLTSVPVSFQIQ